MAGYATLLNGDIPLTQTLSFNTFTGPQDLTSKSTATSQPGLTLPANFLKRGMVIRTTAGGNFSTTGTPTLVFGTYYGSTALGVNVALTTASGAATLPWRLETTTTFQTDGAAGTAITQGELWYGTTLTAVTQIPIPGIALATVTVDTTASAAWAAKATYSASSASNIVTCSTFTVELLSFIP